MSVGQRLGTSPSQDYVLLGLLAIGGYVLYKVFSGVEKIASGAAAAGAQVADVYDQASEVFDTTPDPSAATWVGWYDPTQRSVFVYVLTFPDGSHGIVWGHDVQSDGTFVKNNSLYRIGTDKSGGLRAYQYSRALGDGAPAIAG